MYCKGCGSFCGEGLSFCRACGAAIDNRSLKAASAVVPERTAAGGLVKAPARDLDEMTAEGIGSIIVGDGFFITAVILSATHTAISSLLWLLLLVPAFFCFGRGMKDVLYAARIRRRMKREALGAAREAAEIRPPRASVADIIGARTSGGLLATGRTTGEL
jgi:hypothetical protein